MRDYLLPILIVIFLAALPVQTQSIVAINAIGPRERLSPHIVPQHYKISITTFVDMPNGPYNGTVEIDLKVLQPARILTFHAKTMEIDTKTGISLHTKSNGRALRIQKVVMWSKEQQVNVVMEQPLTIGKEYVLRIRFAANLNRENSGFYRGSYVDPRTTLTEWLAATQFEPINARDAFPCFDDPRFRTSHYIELSHSKAYRAFSNMPALHVRKDPVDAKLVWTAFQESVAMPTYQIAFSLNKFESRISSDTNNSTTFRTWARKYALNQTEYAAEIAPQLLEFLEVFLETPYDLPKVDNLALPDFAYASSSNWGLNIFTEDAILFDEKRCTLLDKQSVAMNIAKELAHQWFGNLVSIEWWHDVWLKDAFAEYIAGFGLHMIEPSWYYMDRRTLENEFKVLELDAHVHTDPVATPVANDTEVWAAYDKNSVRKAIALLGMLHRLVGDEIIINTYRQYLQQFSHKTATQKDFWTVSQREADNAGRLPKGMAIAQLMESWTLQMGYPILNVTRDYKKRTARITQQRFFITPLQATDEGEVNATKTRFYCWWVPLSYTNASSKNFDYTLPRSWLTCKNKNFAMPVTITDAGAPQDWLVLNLKLSALYRVNYDSRNWELIKATLDGDNYQAIHKINRAQLVDDALNLAWSGTLTYHFSLGLIGFLKREEAYMVWAAAARSLDRVNNIVKNSPAYPVFKSFMRDLLGPKFDEIFVKPSAGNSLDTLYRVIIFQQACHYELLACVNFARDEFAKLRRVPTLNAPDSVPADIQETLFCTAIRFGNEADWTWLKNNYMRSNVAAEQKLMLAALGCSRDTWSLEIMLKWTFAGKLVRKHAAQRTFRAVVKNPLGYHLAKKFLSENAFVIRNFCQNMTGRLVEVIKPLFEEVSTQEDLDYWTNFLRSHFKNMPGIERLKKLLLELGKDNMFWRRTKYNELLSAIRSLIKIEEIPEL